MESIIGVVLALAALQQNGVGRQETPNPRGAPGRPASWKFESRAGGKVAYDTNVWLLDGGQQDRLEDDRPSDQASGRFDDMESVDDLIVTPDLRLELKGPSPLGRKLGLFFDLEYPYYTRNGRRSHLDLRAGIGQEVGSRGDLELSFGFVPEYFRKNYLADAVDANGNGDISSAERIYEDGTYREWDLELEYRHKLVDRTPQQSFGLVGSLALGLRHRTYDSPFDGKDEEAPFFRLGLKFELGPKVRWGVEYRYETIDAPTESEVVLINEVAYGSDVNGDAILADDARTVTRVDRSRVQHTVRLSFGYEFTAAVEGGVFYARTLKEWSSDEPLDLSHTDREDTRDEVGLFLKIRLSKAWDGRIGWEWREQQTDQPDDPGASGETFDYKKTLFFLSAGYSW